MIDKRFNKEVQEVLRGRLKIGLTTISREATNDEGQPVIQTVVKADLLWQTSPEQIDTLDIAETVVLELPGQPVVDSGLQG